MFYVRLFLLPFSCVYGVVIFLRNWLYDIGFLHSETTKVFSIVVGNISVGGTGKTPHVEYLIRLLSGKKIAVLSRGYKRKSKGFVWADKNSRVSDLGDEPFQYFQKFKIPVAVDTNRLSGIRKILKHAPQTECIVLDDAFQHRKLIPHIAIVLTCYDDLYVNDFLLPAGNLRDTKKQIQRADIVVVTKCPVDLSEQKKIAVAKKLSLKPHQKLFFSKIVYASFIKNENNHVIALNTLSEYHILLITGIANPKPLQNFLDQKNIKYTHLKYSDHHEFSSREIKNITKKYERIARERKLMLTTEKDFMRLKEKLPEVYYIGIAVAFFKSTPKTFDEVLLHKMNLFLKFYGATLLWCGTLLSYGGICL